MKWEEFQLKKLTDVGSRYLHYSEMISVWEEAAQMIESQRYVGKDAQQKLDNLRTSIAMLRSTLDGMSEYRDQVLSLRKLVDWVPTDPELIPGGRGTPIKEGEEC